MTMTDHEEFFAYTRFWPEQYKLLLKLVTPYLKKYSFRKPLSPNVRLAITLKYLAQCDTLRSKHLEYRCGKSTVHKIIPEVCNAIWLALQPIVLPTLNSENWKEISKNFFLKWQFPNCIGALDGRHMEIEAPPCSGSEFYNYKGYFSIVLMAMCDANYKFTWVDIGQHGKYFLFNINHHYLLRIEKWLSDGGVWSRTDLAVDLENSTASLPEPTPLPNRDVPFPYFTVADEAFPLKPYLMRPFPRKVDRMTNEERIFNYRLGRARLCIENAFGILSSRWRILHRKMCCSVQNAEKICKALVCLHNFAMSSNDSNGQYCQPDWCDVENDEGIIIEDRWRTIGAGQYFKELSRIGANRAGAISLGLRNYLKDYFMSPIGNAQAPWQFKRALRGYNINLPDDAFVRLFSGDVTIFTDKDNGSSAYAYVSMTSECLLT
ncbi:protein ALP1-like [Harpegnathos saltator]|uniref:protein ALP1-like n=1 Tax=Harpegnathos saltator TaxID=610380 RepID=UPI000DBEE0A5|nr:protein ALP1-like [Harpegnathos saltator]